MEMETEEPGVIFDRMAQFDSVATQIITEFNSLISKLTARRDALLQKLDLLREDFMQKEDKVKSEISQRVMPKELQVFPPSKLPNYFFQCPKLEKIKNLIAGFGEVGVIAGVPDYKLKINPILCAGMKGRGAKQLSARGIAIDEANQRIYIADCFNSRIQVVSLEGKFLSNFGQGILKMPCGIIFTKKYFFVSDYGLHELLLFDRDSCNLVNRVGAVKRGDSRLHHPHGLCMDDNGEIFLTDYANNRICKYSKDLQFLTSFGSKQIQGPSDIKLTPTCVIVLNRVPGCFHFFSRNGDYITSSVTQGQNYSMMPSFFCLDSGENLIVSDLYNNCINIISETGRLVHTIGSMGHNKGRFRSPWGIGITELGRIYVVSDNRNYSLQCF